MARLAGKGGDVYIASLLVEDCEDAWNEQVVGNVTASADTSDYKAGSASAKFVVAAGFATGVIGSETISKDLRLYTSIMAWVKSSVNLSAADYQILLDDNGDCASPTETLDVPALTAATWKYIRVDLVTPANLAALISIGLNQAVDKGAMNFWIDDVRAAVQIAGVKSWSIDQAVEVFDVTGFDSGGVRQYVATVSGWSGSFEGYKDGAPLTIGTQVGLELRESSTATQQFRGSVIITGFKPKTEVAGVVVYDYTFQGLHGLEIATA